MVTRREFRNGHSHNVNYGEIGIKILESKEPEDLWKLKISLNLRKE